ncbi:MAG: molecular chaperone DnaJ [Deltaproteobacteria bacterium]|nr:molecular chaperone DnaJ [Deltaproteobacteria bacterium]
MSKILLVENHAATRDYLANVLRSAGHTVKLASDEGQAWELFATERPDVIAVSLHHPDAAPLVARARETTTAMPVIAYDHGHLSNLLGKSAAMRLKPDAYVADISQRELLDQLSALSGRWTTRPDTQPQGTAALLARAPALQGQLREGTLPATLVTLARTFRDGALVLQQGEIERRLYLRLGVPVSFESTERSEAFDRWAVEVGKITEAQLAEALRERAGGALSPAASLVAVGAVEPGPPLMALLREHLQAMLARLVGIRQGRFRFHAGDEFLTEVQALEVPALAHVLVGARAHLPLRVFLSTLLPDRARFPRRSDDFSEHLAQLGLQPRDLRLALELNGEHSVDELLAARRSQLREMSSLLWFLRLADVLSFEATRKPLERGSTPLPLAAERLKPLPSEQLAEVRESALAVLPSTYFHALGVDIAATPDEVEQALLKSTEQLHPDRFAGFDVAEVDDLLTQVQDRLTAAHRVLSSPEKRQGYLEHIFSKVEGLRGGRPIVVSAEVALKEAERALRNRRASDALERVRAAASLAPKEPDFQARLAMLELLDRSRSDAERRANARKAAKKALTLDPEHAHAMLALAMLAREEGDLSEARKLTLAALKLRPKLELARWLLRELNRVP